MSGVKRKQYHSITNLVNFLIEPIPEKLKKDHPVSNAIRFLSASLLVSGTLTAVGSTIYFYFNRETILMFILFLSFSLLALVFYVYCRLGFYRQTIILTTISGIMLIYSVMFIDYTHFLHYCYCTCIGALLVTTIAPVHYICLLYLINNAAIIFISNFLPEKIPAPALGLVFIFLTTINGLIVILKLQRDKLMNDGRDHLAEALDATIFALAYEAELRDETTGKHLERTSLYVKLLAEKLKNNGQYKNYITDAYLNDLMKASILHDIGKVGIPDSILFKPGKLTAEEFKLVKKHCEYGATILLEAQKRITFESFFNIAIQIVRSHHERWDGNGYPDKLKAEDISLSARIMSICDVYDALRTKRCYKAPLPHDECVRIILAERGRQFDPVITDCFMECEQEFYRISIKCS